MSAREGKRKIKEGWQGGERVVAVDGFRTSWRAVLLGKGSGGFTTHCPNRGSLAGDNRAWRHESGKWKQRIQNELATET